MAEKFQGSVKLLWIIHQLMSHYQKLNYLQSGGFLRGTLQPLLKTDLPLMKNVLKALAKSVLIPVGLKAAASAADFWIHNKILGLPITTILISNKEINNIMKIVKSFEKSGLLIKVVSKTTENKAKEQKCGFLGMLLGILGASLLGNL